MMVHIVVDMKDGTLFHLLIRYFISRVHLLFLDMYC